MSQRADREFLKLYQTYRYEDQLNWYRGRQEEFRKAQAQGLTVSIGLIFLAGLANALEAVDVLWVRVLCLLAAAICPVLSTAFAAYNALYAFEHQAKLYRDTINALLHAHALSPELKPGLSEAELAQEIDTFVQEVEKTFLVEQGQWGQLAREMKPPDL